MPSLNVLLPAETEHNAMQMSMQMTGAAHDEDEGCFPGGQSRLPTAKEVHSDINGIVGGTWGRCCQPVERLAFLLGHTGRWQPARGGLWQPLQDPGKKMAPTRILIKQDPSCN